MHHSIVVFIGSDLIEGGSWYGRFLKEGFVHCFVLIQSNEKWIKIDGHRGKMIVKYIGNVSDLESHYRNQGATVVNTIVRDRPLLSPMVARNCVGLIKCILGIRSFAFTPWQLYKHLKRYSICNPD